MPRSATLPGVESSQSDLTSPNLVSPRTAQSLLQIFRVMFPHEVLDNSYYERAIDKIIAISSKDRATADLIENGISRLESQYHWAELSETDRLLTLKEIEGSAFFQALRTEFIFNFYGDPVVWNFLGYEGPSNDLGGYVNRGFGDIDWLEAD
jgi:hypothetical protein